MKYVGVFVTSHTDSTLNSKYTSEKSPGFNEAGIAREWLNKKADMFNKSLKPKSDSVIGKIRFSVVIAIDEEQSDADFDRVLKFLTTQFN